MVWITSGTEENTLIIIIAVLDSYQRKQILKGELIMLNFGVEVTIDPMIIDLRRGWLW